MSSDERVSELLWSCMSYDEMCERVADLEELATDMFELLDRSGATSGAFGPCMELLKRMRLLRIEICDEWQEMLDEYEGMT